MSRSVFRLEFVVLALGLSACSPSEIMYIDSTARLATPEILSAWTGSPLAPSTVVYLNQVGPSEISADLKLRRPAPQGVIICTSVTSEQISRWQEEFLKTRFVVLRPPGSSSTIAHFELPQVASWKELAARARATSVSTAQAVAVVPASTPDEALEALQQGWLAAGSAAKIDVILADPVRPPTDEELTQHITRQTTDVFVLGIDPTRVAIPVINPGVRVHRDASWTGSEAAPGWAIRLNKQLLGEVLHTAVRPGAPPVVYLPWEIAPKTPFSRS